MRSGAGKGGLAFGVLAGAVIAAVAWATGCTRHAAGDVRIIAHGEEVDLAANLVAGKYTVFDFYAPWCPPCRIVGPALERLAERRPGEVAIRKIDIVDWTMPVAAQHGVESLPHLVLYAPDGRRLADGDAVFDVLVRTFGDAAREVGELTEVEPEEAPGGEFPGRGPTSL